MFRCKASRSNLVRRTLFPHGVKKGPWGRKRFAKMPWHKVKNEVNERYTSSRNVTVALRMRTTVLPGQGKHGHLFRPYIMSYLHGIADNFWFSLTWWDGHVGVQNNVKISLKFCIIVNSRKTFFLYSSVHQHGRRDVTWKPRIVACWLLYNLPLEGVTGADWNSMYAFGQSEKR